VGCETPSAWPNAHNAEAITEEELCSRVVARRLSFAGFLEQRGILTAAICASVLERVHVSALLK